MRLNYFVIYQLFWVFFAAPVLHVNADRLRDVHVAAQLATRYRQQFGKDIILDLWGFRVHGHNEIDEPRITNVKLYQEIDHHAPVSEIFAATGISHTHLPPNQLDGLQNRIAAEYDLTTATANVDARPKPLQDSGNSEWQDLRMHPISVSCENYTAVDKDALKAALATLTTVPDGFTIHPLVNRTISRRAELLHWLESEKAQDDEATIDLSSSSPSAPKVDWATAELLALTTLVQQQQKNHHPYFCRLSGQDSQRGTFGQRHAIWHDAVTGNIHHAIPPYVHVIDSPLSELAVLGFELGISLASPNFLVLWEAQFGDFCNNTQVLIDTMISSEKDKFGLDSNLVLLLPHGNDGMGPEHSSCRLERFLTLHTDSPECAMKTDQRAENDDKDDGLERYRQANFVVCNPTTPANYFHLLRRTFSWPFRRPLVVLTPKRTLRLPQATSPISKFLIDHRRHPSPETKDSPTGFCPVLDDPRESLDKSKVESIVVCSGGFYYDVLQQVQQELSWNISQSVAIVRVEQLAPFPMTQLKRMLDQQHYPQARRMVWVQEEPQNMGARRFVEPFLDQLMNDSISIGIPLQRSDSIARDASAAPGVGNPHEFQASRHVLLSKVIDWIQSV